MEIARVVIVCPGSRQARPQECAPSINERAQPLHANLLRDVSHRQWVDDREISRIIIQTHV
jgi:hypothetical protein